MSSSLYLSRLVLDPRSRRVQRELANPYELHRTVMHAFGEPGRGDGERVLYRVDHMRGEVTLALLVQSAAAPDWRFLRDEPGARGYLAQNCGDNPAVKLFAPELRAGQVLAFRLRANPTVRRAGKRLGLYRIAEQLAWLERKGQQAGFELLHARATNEDVLGGTLHREGVEHRLRLLSVRFDGQLRVTDPDRLAAALAAGIGSGKGFGFGLLSLARPQS